MAQTARIHDIEPSAADRSQPPLRVVQDTATHAAEPAAPAEPAIGRNALVGAAAGFLAVTTAITVAGTLGGIGAVDSFGIGAFTGIWGGAGFGFMMGATIPLARHLDAHPAGSTRAD